MAIQREGSEFRIERSAKKSHNQGVFLLMLIAVGAGFIALQADEVLDWAIAAAWVVGGLLLHRGGVRQRVICIVRPNQIGHGHVGGKMYWIDSGPVAEIRLVRSPWFIQVRCVHEDGRERESFTVGLDFEEAELREAFESVGIRVR